MFEAKTAAGSRGTPDAARQQGGDGAGGWFGLDLLAELQIVNLKTIHWLRALARQDVAATPGAALLAENRSLWLALDDVATAQLSACPCALTDAEFANSATWELIAAAAVRDAAPRAQRDAGAVLLDDPAGRQLARLTVNLGWHLARHRPLAATVTLGMCSGTMQQLQGMRLATVDVLPDWLPALVRPRWHDEPRVWTYLLEAAISAAPLRLESARVGALQLIARQLAKARERETGR
jgi:hypothetical protein